MGGADTAGNAACLMLPPVASGLAEYTCPTASARFARCAHGVKCLTLMGLRNTSLQHWVASHWSRAQPPNLVCEKKWPVDASALDELLDEAFINTNLAANSVSKADDRGNLPLHTAARKKCPRLVDLLLCARASPNLASTLDGRTALHYAAQAGSTRCVSLLLEARADAELRDHLRRVPFELAVRMGHEEV